CTWAAERIPSTWGTVWSGIAGHPGSLGRRGRGGGGGRGGPGRCAGRAAGVDHEALAEHRVQEALGPAGGGGGLRDVPDQEAVVGLDEGVVVVGGADRALQPPVRAVEGVGEPGRTV